MGMGQNMAFEEEIADLITPRGIPIHHFQILQEYCNRLERIQPNIWHRVTFEMVGHSKLKIYIYIII